MFEIRGQLLSTVDSGVQRAQVLVVDDQPRARSSMRALLATWPMAGTVREAANGREALSMVEAYQPDLILMDARMPEMDGLIATRLIKARWPQVRIVVLSMYGEYCEAALAAGADAFVSKVDSPDRLLAALATVMRQGGLPTTGSLRTW